MEFKVQLADRIGEFTVMMDFNHQGELERFSVVAEDGEDISRSISNDDMDHIWDVYTFLS